MAYKLRYSDYSGNGSGPPNPEAWVGPQGPQGPPGATGRVSALSTTLHVSLPGATATALLLVNARQLFALQIKCTQSGGGNYSLQLLNGNAGTVVYEATGITDTVYNDVASVFLETTTDLWVKLLQVDPVAIECDVLFRYLDIT